MFYVKHSTFDKFSLKTSNHVVKMLAFGKTNTGEVVLAQNLAIVFMHKPIEKTNKTCYYIITDRRPAGMHIIRRRFK